MWKNIASFILGFAIGGTAVYFSCKEKFEKEEREAIDSVQKFYRERDIKREKETLERLRTEKAEIASKILGYRAEGEQDEKVEKEPKEVPQEGRKSPHREKETTEYNKMYKQKKEYEIGKDITEKVLGGIQEEPEGEFDEDISDEEDEWLADDAPIEHEKPYIISQNEFANGRLWFDKYDFVYFEDDDVLLDSYTNEIVDSLENTIGENFKIFFDDDDGDVMYIRNEETGADYSVTRIHGSYHDEEE